MDNSIGESFPLSVDTILNDKHLIRNSLDFRYALKDFKAGIYDSYDNFFESNGIFFAFTKLLEGDFYGQVFDSRTDSSVRIAISIDFGSFVNIEITDPRPCCIPFEKILNTIKVSSFTHYDIFVQSLDDNTYRKLSKFFRIDYNPNKIQKTQKPKKPKTNKFSIFHDYKIV